MRKQQYRQWIHDNYRVILEEQAQHTLDGAVGRVSFANGDCQSFTDPQKYLQTVQKELPHCTVTGFCYETLTDDPTVRKAVDDILYDLFCEENPHTLEDYKNF